MVRTFGIALLGAGLLGCGPELELKPASGSSFGNYPVVVTGPALDALGDPVTVSVGSLSAYNVARTGKNEVTFTVQGGPSPGAQAVEVAGPKGTLKGVFSYLPPADSSVGRLVAIGASLTMGAQSGGLSLHSQLFGPAAQFAKAAGAYLSLPLVQPGILPMLQVSDFDPDTCQLPGGQSITTLITTRGLADAVPKLQDPSGGIHIDWARIDPNIEVRNVAIAGFRITEAVNGGAGVIEVILEHAVWDPFVSPSNLFNPPSETMLDRAVALQPTVVINTDIFGNDVDNVSLTTSGIPDLSALTSMPAFQSALSTLLTRLDGTGADYFLATCPDVTALPQYDAKVQSLLAAGYTDAEATGWLLAIRQRLADFNSTLFAAAAQHPKLHIVDLFSYVADVMVNGIDVGGTHLTGKPMGGLLSLDGMHFSDTGYALLAEQYVKAVNQALGASIPDIDPVPILAEDPYSVASLQAQGLTCAGK